MKGQDLLNLLQNHPDLLISDVKYTIMELLRRSLIRPSTLIDAHLNIVETQRDKYMLHYKEANIAAHVVLDGQSKEQVEWGKKRLMYNSIFDRGIPYEELYADRLSEEERSKCRDFFKLLYGFDPEGE